MPKEFSKTLSAMSLRVGIPVNFQFSCFSTGTAQSVLTLAEIYMVAGYTVELIQLNTENVMWWEDVTSLKNIFTVIKLDDMKEYDLIIESGINTLPPEKRVFAKKCVWFNRKAAIFHDIEASLYPILPSGRNMEGIHEIWIYEEFCNTDDIQYLELLTRKPVRTLPFIWSPLLVESYKKETGLGLWKRVNGVPFSIHISETNTSSSSSPTIPLLIIRELCHKSSILLNKKIKIHNSESLYKSDFFKKNVVDHVFSDITSVEPQIIGRQRIVDFLSDPNSVIVAHSRFIPIRPYVMDAVWLGIPVVHNSPLLQEIYPFGYYTGNSIHDGRLAFEKVTSALIDQAVVCKRLLERFSPMSPSIQKSWIDAATSNPMLLTPSLYIPTSTPAPAPTHLRVGFCSMWSDFNAEYNMFTLILEKFGTGPVIGINVENKDADIDVLIFGPFSSRWQSISTKIPKVHYTGENTEPIIREDVKLNLGFKRIPSDSYIRLPLWMVSIDWWNIDADRIVNPKPIPVERCCLTFSNELKRKKKFCAFVVTNPCQPIRNNAFKWLNTYKSVDSAGRLYNTMGDSLFAGLGGGGGELKKLEFLKDYKFCLCYENASSPGYTTEKLLHAKAAGCIPIYWGDPTVDNDFNMEGCINANECKSKEELVALVKDVDENYDKYLYKYNIPLLDTARKIIALKTLSDCANRIYSFIPDKLQSTAIVNGKPYKCSQISTTQTRVIITACNWKYLYSVIRLIESTTVPVYVWTFDMKQEHTNKIKNAGGIIIPFDTTWNPEWPDFWNTCHYAWKPLVMTIANTVFPVGTSVIYMDSGIEIVGSLDRIWNSISTNNIFTIKHDYTIMYKSHPIFCKNLNVTTEELHSNQFDTSIVGFKIGTYVQGILQEYSKYACNPELIVGHTWYKYSEVCMGHGHDQSIFSIVCLRNSIQGYSKNEFVGSKSHDLTVTEGLPLYQHRAVWKQGNDTILKGISSSYVINLEHRSDRLQTFWNNHPYLRNICKNIPAVNGRTIPLTKDIHKLFKNNDFKWKKSVMGCALSHYSIWRHLISTDTNNTSKCLILEDDGVLVPGFINKWNAIYKTIPEDADVIFLGGVLPPNKPAFPQIIDSVNANFAKVAKNSLFSSVKRRYFHFCTYSYIITKQGAEKMCKFITEKGIFTSIDHMMVNHGDDLLNIYFTTPLLGGCTQDNDPVYQHADFNNFNRVDTIDSDIWTNKDVFTEEEIASLYIRTPLTVVYFEEEQEKQMIDSEWLGEIFNKEFKWVSSTENVSGSVLLYYQHVTNPARLEEWISKNPTTTIYLLHASDEACRADISIYKNPRIKHIFRNYWRPEAVAPNLTHLPLGYLNGKGRGDNQVLLSSSRKHTWSFAGAMDRNNRRSIIENLQAKYPTTAIHLTPTWNSPSNLNTHDYVNIIRNSKYVPCLDGFFNTESYRLYEAMENGAIPITCVDAKKSYQHIFGCAPPFIMIDDWSKDCISNDVDLKQRNVIEWWHLFKNGLCEKIKKIFT